MAACDHVTKRIGEEGTGGWVGMLLGEGGGRLERDGRSIFMLFTRF